MEFFASIARNRAENGTACTGCMPVLVGGLHSSCHLFVTVMGFLNVGPFAALKAHW